MLLFLLAACSASNDPAFDPTGARSDSGYIAGVGTGDTDTGADGDTGEDTSGNTDTGTPICGASDLTFVVLVEDGSGDTGLAFSSPVDITTRAVFTNPCNGLLRFTTADACLVNSWTLTRGTGVSLSISGSCLDAETTWSFAAEESASVTILWGQLERSTYQITASSTPVGRSATEFFSVQ